MEYEQILFEREGPVGVVTLNRPEKLNPFTWKMIQEILNVLHEMEKDDGIRVLVITGAGRAFSSGDDMSGAFFKGAPWEYGLDIPPFALMPQHRLITALRQLRKPVIAMINGLAHGMGSDVALACDFRIASEEARLGDIRMQKGINPGTGATFLMPQVIGLTRAVELLLTGDTIDAREAERIGLVNRTVPAGELRSTVMELANRLATGPIKAIGIAKAQIYGELGMTMDEAWAHWASTVEPVEDTEEGVKAFFEKRAPRYKGK
jgi:2-(1,2-epoxy-1,2-dihydrophenyl)acetyl-CoA isomerase